MSHRKLTSSEEEVVDGLYKKKSEYKDVSAYATLTKDLSHNDYSGKAGQTVKIIMVSRLGDFGLTNDLSRINGYQVRLDVESDYLKNIRLKP